jgi:type IV pilus assembly protein PilC
MSDLELPRVPRPVVWSLAIIAVLAWLFLWKVVPTWATEYEWQGITPSLPMQMLIALSNFIGAWWWLIFLCVGGGYLMLRNYQKPGGVAR